jgi:hypothetical protein
MSGKKRLPTDHTEKYFSRQGIWDDTYQFVPIKTKNIWKETFSLHHCLILKLMSLAFINTSGEFVYARQ